MSNNQATIEDLIDEMYDVLDKGWKMPLSSGKVLVDSEEIRAILDDIRDVFPEEINQAKTIVADHGQIINEAKREGDSILQAAEERAKALVSQEEVVLKAQQRANEILTQAQAQARETKKACNEYVEDIMRRTDESISESLTELRKTRQNIKNSQRSSQM
ncbi:ATPase [Acutalibacter muris]|jgi:F0F1-type ATP synthase membrane subunit b/b'|uniref:ATPase n=1 Tax=Acutalibacter muris TaxID=1796620 RepID=A0A1Z2XT85_9FIRM|nr:ATPase [Acutalibacter muris]ANU55125.1 ATPase [Hungateiclostridiaceae bacterium KB18]ASB41640.1 ATPase [Acutalibacter muris]MCI9192168.1 ATPase [Acutalibacter muris]MCI9543434.1 ATPase [Acutalibacter muris]QQR30901.1 ATPase [Acutalibacter muris]